MDLPQTLPAQQEPPPPGGSSTTQPRKRRRRGNPEREEEGEREEQREKRGADRPRTTGQDRHKGTAQQDRDQSHQDQINTTSATNGVREMGEETKRGNENLWRT